MSAKIVNVTLKNPIKLGDKKEIKSIDIREPKAGELRGISVLDILRMEVSAFRELLPRITSPILTKEQIDDFSFGDIAQIMSEVSDFLEAKG
jgi:hypothetical protein